MSLRNSRDRQHRGDGGHRLGIRLGCLFGGLGPGGHAAPDPRIVRRHADAAFSDHDHAPLRRQLRLLRLRGDCHGKNRRGDDGRAGEKPPRLAATATPAARRRVAMTAAKSAYTTAIIAFMIVLPISPDLFVHSFFAGPIRRSVRVSFGFVTYAVTSSLDTCP